MKLTQELIDKIQEAMLHTNLKGEINWKDGDDIIVQVAGLNLILILIMRRKYLQKMVEKNMKKN